MTAHLDTGIIPTAAIESVRDQFSDELSNREIVDALAATQARSDMPLWSWTAAAVRWLELRGYRRGGDA